MAVITRWSYKRGGRKAGFHCNLKLKNISVYYYLQKTSMSIIKMSEEGQLFKC